MKLPVATFLLGMMATKVRATSMATCHVNPDPHFKTWDTAGGIYYDYHGGCDLVLIKNPTFDGADELNLHIRTKAFPGWGGITNAALEIGGDVLEVQDDGTSYFNGGVVLPSTMGTIGYAITHTTTGAQDVWEVALAGSQYIRIVNFNWGGAPPTAGSITIEVHADKKHFSDSVGMCGTWGTPGLIARDGVTDFQGPPTAGTDMGLEWQVNKPPPPPIAPPEPQLFTTMGAPVCTPPIPGGSTGGDNPDIQRQAEDACEHLEGEEFNNCVFDIMVTGNVLWAEAPLYHKYKCASKQNICKKKGGKCVLRRKCDATTHFCNPHLCYATNIPHWLHDLDIRDDDSGRRLTNEGELVEEREDERNSVRRRLQDNLNADLQDNVNADHDGHPLSVFRDPCVCAIPRPSKSGECCQYTGPTPYNCAAIELLGPGADIDGRCNQVNGGHSCVWDYTNPKCCEIAMNDANCKLPTDEAVEQCECALEKQLTPPGLPGSSPTVAASATATQALIARLPHK